MNFSQTESTVERLFSEGTVSSVALKVGRYGDVLFEKYASKDKNINENTLFDMASVTKIICTTTLALEAMDEGILDPSDSVGRFFDLPSDKKELTVGHLLTHTMGYGHKSLNKDHVNQDNVADYILNIPCDESIGSKVIYSCPAFILLGKILEKLYQKPLDIIFKDKVTVPLKMSSTGFGGRGENLVNSNISPDMAGIVNDYNCRHLGGVCGNAGVFSCMKDLSLYVSMLLSRGADIISRETFEKAVKNYTEGKGDSRGLGFLIADENYAQASGLFAPRGFGHCGHTGQSLFVDPDTGLWVIILSDATVSTVKKYGKENYAEVKQMRSDIHRAIAEDILKEQ
jgi:CubicO group peptidase (beta-lactamase class C family)